MTDLATVIARAQVATGPDREVDAAICEWLRDNEGFTPSPSDAAYPFYAFTASLDAAKSLYLSVPEQIPSAAHLAAVEALGQRVGP
jgi:hypothetical protein